MKLFALAAAATVALATAASAMAPSQVAVEAQNTLNEYGFNVDADTLSRSQWVAINAADNDSERSRVEVQSLIASALRN
ncbi:MAG: hypothetical protein QNJ13_14965 [Paracoccaceae bacterium]|nr:hypothetical protein [Paracoccaceae bacterium]